MPIYAKYLNRTLLKTVSFACCHFAVAFMVAYLLTGSIGISSLLALVEPMCNTVAYFFHEKLWERFVTHKIESIHAVDSIGVEPISGAHI